MTSFFTGYLAPEETRSNAAAFMWRLSGMAPESFDQWFPAICSIPASKQVRFRCEVTVRLKGVAVFVTVAWCLAGHG